MKKRFLATLLTVALLLSLFTTSVAADSTITITLDKTYSDDTFAGTYLSVTSSAALSDGQTIAYFLNGTEVGEVDAAGAYNFVSVAGENKLQAKIMNGDEVIATSNEIAVSFKPLSRVNVIKSDYFEYDSLTLSNYYNSANTGNGYGHSVVYESGEAGNRVLKYHAKKENGITQTYLGFPNDGIYNSTKDAKYVSFEYDIKFEKISVPVRLFLAQGQWRSENYEIIGPSVQTDGTVNGVNLNDGQWHNVKLIIDMTTSPRTYDVYAGGYQVVTDGEVPAAFTSLNLLNLPRATLIDDADYTTFYVDDVEVCAYDAPSVSLTVSADNAIAGRRVMLTATKTLADDLQLVYNVNGVDSEPTAALTYNATAIQGTNTAYVTAVDTSGNTVLTSDAITFDAMPYTETYVKDMPFASDWHLNAGSFSFEKYNNPDEDGDEVIAERIQLTGADAEASTGTNAGDYAVRLKVANTGNDYNQKATVYINRYNWLTTEPVATNMKPDIASLKWKVKLVSMGKEESDTFMAMYYGNDSNAEKIFVPFRFTADGKLKIATTFNPSVGTEGHYILIPAPTGQWYNFEFIADGKNEVIYLVVNDVVYSSFSFDAVADAAAKFNLTNSLGRLRLQMVMGFGGVGTATNEIYLTDLAWWCGKSVSDLYTTPTFYNAGREVTTKADIDYRGTLDVEFDAYNNGNNLMCIASVIDSDKRLLSVDMQSVNFAKGDTIKSIDLSLANLPEDIATNGNYKIQLMIWDGTTLAPINDVIPFN